MKKSLLLLILLLFQFQMNAQDILMFPESDIIISNKLSLNSCIRQCSELMEGLNTKDSASVFQLREGALQLTSQGKHELAEDIFSQLLQIAKQQHGTQHLHYAHALLDMARVNILLIRYSTATRLYQESLAVLRNTTGYNSREYLVALNEIAILYARDSEFSTAMIFFKKGLSIIKEINQKNTIQHAIILNNIGAIYKCVGKYKEAISFYNKALEVAKNNPRYMVSIAANLAEAMAYNDQKKEAIALLDKYSALGQQKLIKKDLVYARVWLQYADAYLVANAFDKAEKALKYGLVTNSLTFDKIDNLPDIAHQLMFHNEFLATCGQAALMITGIEVYRQRYLKTRDIEQLKKGYQLIKAITKYSENLINSAISEQDKLKLFKLGVVDLFDKGLYSANQLYQNTGDRRYLDDAFFWAERSKSTLLVNALRAKGKQTYLNLPANLVEREKKYMSQSKKLEKQWLQASSQVEKDKTRHLINELDRAVNDFKKELKQTYPTYYKHRYNNTLVDLETLQAQLKDNQILVEYFVGKIHHYALVVSPSTIDFVALDIDENELEKNTALFRKSLSDYKYLTATPTKAKASYQATAYYFYQKFIAPILDEKTKGKHLIIIPDGCLGHLPFEVFLSKPPQQKNDYANLSYLLRDYTISYSYSATIFLAQSQIKKKSAAIEKGILAFAAEYDSSSAAQNIVRSKRGENIAKIRQTLEPLPGANMEVAMMQKYLYGAYFNGWVANEQNFKEKAANYSIIHLAMHGVLNPKSPILSSLVFSEDNSSDEDNFLHAYEIAQLDLNADLVVLSACETGYGKFQQGEGIMSLAHSFTYAGASSVLMSLWQVNDYSTGLIMKNFYTNLAKGMTKDKALQQAKLTYINNAKTGITQHPAFWAAFVQQGNVQPLELVSKTGIAFRYMPFVVGSVILALGSVLFWWFRKRKKLKYNELD